MSGYEISGASTLTCSAGSWDQSSPSCIEGALDEDECARKPNPCSADRDCLDRPVGYICVCQQNTFDVGGTCRASKVFKVTMKILKLKGLKATYISDYSDPQSEQHAYVTQLVKDDLDVALKPTYKTSYFGAHISSFFEGSLGTVVFTYFDQNNSVTAMEVEETLKKAHTNGVISELTVEVVSIVVEDYEDNVCERSSGNDCSLNADCINEGISFTCKCKSGSKDLSMDLENRPGRECELEDRSYILVLAITLGLLCGVLLISLMLFMIIYIRMHMKHNKSKKSKIPIYPYGVPDKSIYYSIYHGTSIDKGRDMESTHSDESEDMRINQLKKNMHNAPRPKHRPNGEKHSSPDRSRHGRPGLEESRQRLPSPDRRSNNKPFVESEDFGVGVRTANDTTSNFMMPYVATGDEAKVLYAQPKKSRLESVYKEEVYRPPHTQGGFQIPARDYEIPRAHSNFPDTNDPFSI
ncbi:uncharacterized protein LOC144434468 [Glandiceps talaboti]